VGNSRRGRGNSKTCGLENFPENRASEGVLEDKEACSKMEKKKKKHYILELTCKGATTIDIPRDRRGKLFSRNKKILSRKGQKSESLLQRMGHLL